MSFSLRSPAFQNGELIPRRYTADGDNVSPPLEWSDPPPGTRSFALIVEDPDAPSGTFRHWGVYNIPGTRRALPEGAEHARAEGLGLAINDLGNARYDGPVPPRGHGVHHYHFRLFALDTESLAQAPKLSVEDIGKAAQEHALAEAELVGNYER